MIRQWRNTPGTVATGAASASRGSHCVEWQTAPASVRVRRCSDWFTRPPSATTRCAAWVLWPLLCLAWATARPGGGAENPSTVNAEQGITFRRVFVPIDQPKQWPREVRYVPIDRAEFEKLLGAIGGAGQLEAARTAAIAAAEYHARLAEPSLLVGQAVWQVVHRGKGAARLELQPCRLAIAAAHWADDQKLSVPIGLGPGGQLGALVDRGGKLQVQWSLAGKAGEDAAAVVFDLQLPDCPVNRLVIDLPKHLLPNLDVGHVQLGHHLDDNVRRWQINLGGHNRVQLRLRQADEHSTRPPTPLVRQNMVYQLEPHGLSLSAELRLDAVFAPLERIEMILGPGLQLTEARLGELDLPCRLGKSADDGSTSAVLTFPTAIDDNGRVLSIRALAPLPLGTSYRLPGIAFKNVSWQSGTIKLVVGDGVILKRLVPIEARQLPGDPLLGWTQLQCFAPQAGAEVLVARREPVLVVNSGVTLTLSTGETAARVIADLSAKGGSIFTAEAELWPAWQIDSIDSTPPGAIEDWSVTKSEDNKQRLSIRLARAIGDGQPMRLAVTARRLRSPLKQELTWNDLLPLRFVGASGQPTLIAIRAADQYHLRLSGAERLKRVDYRALSQTQRELLVELAGAVVFEEDSGAHQLRAALESRQPTFSSSITVEAEAAVGWLRETYSIRCTPQAGAISRVLVRLSQRREEPLRWATVPDNKPPLSARLITDKGQLSDPHGGQETWELTLLRPVSGPLEISGWRRTPLHGRTAIAMAALPEAAAQEGRVVVSSPAPKSIQLRSEGLVRIAPEFRQSSRSHSVCGVYRYQPVADVLDGGGKLWVSVAEEDPTADAVVWLAHLQSCYDTDSARHAARFRIQNSGARAATIALPEQASADDVELSVNQQRTACQWQTEDGRRRLVVDLPSHERFVTVSVGFSTTSSKLGAAGVLVAPWPEIDLPIVSQYWTVWLPSGYAASCHDLRWPWLSEPAPTILQRLLGPLARSAQAQLFDPIDPRTWPIPNPNRIQHDEASGKAQALLQWLGSALPDDGPAGPWARVIGLNLSDAPAVRLLVDAPALAEIGITPQSLVTPLRAVGPTERAVRLLQSSRLAVLVCGDHIVLTSAVQCALWRQWLEPLEFPNVFRVLTGPLSDVLQPSAQSGQTGLVEAIGQTGLVEADVWIHQPAQPRSAWGGELSAIEAGLLIEARPGCRLQVSGVEARLAYAHLPTMRLLGVAAFLLALVVGRWRSNRSSRAFILAALVLAAAALVLPHWYYLPASGAMLGCLTHLACASWLRWGRMATSARAAAGRTHSVVGGAGIVLPGDHNSTAAEEADSPQAAIAPEGATHESAAHESAARKSEADSGTAPGALAGGSAFVVALLCSALTTAAAEPTRLHNQPAKVYQLLIPVDDQQRPAGDKYYLPEKMYEDLSRLAANVKRQQQGWLLAGAVYKGELSREVAADKYRIERLQAIFDLQVLGEAMQVRLPMRRDEVSLAPDAASVDGRPVLPVWESDGTALVVEVAQPGRHLLELTLEPVARDADSTTAVEISIPPAPVSRLELLLPSGAPAVRVPSAVGKVLRQDDPPQLVAELGPTDKLYIDWAGSAAPASSLAVEVEQLCWLRIKPGAVELAARLRLRAPKGQVRQLRLLADPRLRLLPAQKSDGPKAEQGPESGGLQSLLLSWDQPLPERTTLELTFRLSGSLGVGNITFPVLLVPEAKTTRQLIALTADPSLEHVVAHNAGWEPMEPRDFQAAWDKTAVMPMAAFRQTAAPEGFGQAARPELVLAVRPRPARITVQEQSLVLRCSEQEIAVQYGATIFAEEESELQLRLTAPPDLLPSSISLVQDEVDRVAAWSQSDDGRIDVFLTVRISGRSQLTLHGRLPSTLRKKQPLPLICLEQQERTPVRVLIYRTPPVQVLLAKIPGLTELEAQSISAPAGQAGRLVHGIQIEAAQLPKLGFMVVANRPEVSTEQVTWFYRQGDAWLAELECRISVTGGVLDQLYIEAPVNFTLVSPAGADRLYSPPGQPQLFVLPLPQPIAGEHRVRLLGTMLFAPGERVSAPALQLKSATKPRRLLALPKQVQGQTAAWETRGLRPAEPPKDLVPPEAIGAVDFYEAVEESFHAVFRPGATSSSPRVALADIRCRWQTDGTYHAVAVFDVEPGNADSLVLQVPTDYRLLGVDVDGVPVAPVRAASEQPGFSHWVVQAGPSKVWQRITVAFTTPPQRTAPQRQLLLVAPMLTGLPVAQTLWSVVGPPNLLQDPTLAENAIHPWQAEIVRLKHLAEVLYAGSTLGDDDTRLLSSWYRTWAARMVAARREAETRLLAASRDRLARAAALELQTLGQEQSQLANRLGMVPVLDELYRETPVAATRDELWAATFRSAPNQACYRYTGAAPQLVLHYRATQAGDVWPRWLLAAGLLGVAVVAAFVVPSQRLAAKVLGLLGRWASGYPHALLAALGLAWWLWLNPSIVGLLIVMLSVYLAIRPAYRSARPTPPSSIARIPAFPR